MPIEINFTTMRSSTVVRNTNETKIRVAVCLDGGPVAIEDPLLGKVEEKKVSVRSGIKYYDEMVSVLAESAGWSLKLECIGDLHIDDHHTAEDCSLALGSAFSEALGSLRGVRRFGNGFAKQNEALSRAVVDLSNRPFAVVQIPLEDEILDGLSTEMIPHVFESFTQNAGITMHVDSLSGSNDRDRSYSAFKALGLALKSATSYTGKDDVPSTKGVLR